MSNEAASIEQDNLANAEAGFTAPPAVAALAPVALNVAPQAGSDTGGGNTAVLASNATTTALAINAGNGQSIFTGQSFQIASSGQAYSDASYTNGTDATASPGIQSGAPYEFVSPADQEEQQLVGNALNGAGIALNTSPVAPSSSQGFFASVGEAAETESEAYAAGSNVAENFLRATYDFQLAGGIAGAAGLAVGIGTGLQYEGVDLTGDNPISIDSSLAGRVQSSLYNSLALGPSGPDGQSAYNVGIDLNLGASLVLAGAGVIRGGIGLFGAEGAADSAIDSISAENIQATSSTLVGDMGPVTSEGQANAAQYALLKQQYLAQEQADPLFGTTLPGASSPVVVTAEGNVGGQSFFDVNPTARPQNLVGTGPSLVGDVINPLNPNATLEGAHAEFGFIQQASDAGATQGQDMYLTVRTSSAVQPPGVCSYCSAAMGSAVDASGLNSLTIFDLGAGNILQWIRTDAGIVSVRPVPLHP